jgi:hypothetical protein
VLLRFGPLSKCFDRSHAGAGCWNGFLVGGPEPVIGAPVIDRQGGRAYVLTGAGVAIAPLEGGSQLQVLEMHIPFRWPGGALTGSVMVDDPQGRLYVAAGTGVRRFEPRAAQIQQRFGRPFAIGKEGEVAELLAIDAAGNVLEVIRSKAATSLATVCLQRCPTCPCR